MGVQGDKSHQIHNANLVWLCQAKDPLTTHSHQLYPYFTPMQWRRHTPKTLLSPAQNMFPQLLAGHKLTELFSELLPFSSLQPGMVMGRSFEEADLTNAELVQKMPRDSEIQGLAESQEFRTDLPQWSQFPTEQRWADAQPWTYSLLGFLM